MEANKQKAIIKYILFKIYSNSWKPKEKIPSKKALSIKFNVSTSIIFNILKTFKESGLIVSKKRKGYYVSQNKNSFFFYSINEFNKKNTIVETIIENVDFKLPNDILEKVISIDNKFKNTINDFKVFKRIYFLKGELNKKIKISYFIVYSEIYGKLKNIGQLKTTPLYQFFAINNFLITKINSIRFYSDYNDKRCWTNLELTYDFDDKPMLINLIYHLDTNSDEILSIREHNIL